MCKVRSLHTLPFSEAPSPLQRCFAGKYELRRELSTRQLLGPWARSSPGVHSRARGRRATARRRQVFGPSSRVLGCFRLGNLCRIFGDADFADGAVAPESTLKIRNDTCKCFTASGVTFSSWGYSGKEAYEGQRVVIK